MPNPNPTPVVFPTLDKSCPKCGNQLNYPSDAMPGRTVSITYNATTGKVKLTCYWCGYSAEFPAAS